MRFPSAYTLKSFYNSAKGKAVQLFIGRKIDSLWFSLRGQRLMGYGYALPYLEQYQENGNQVFNLMPAQLGVHSWILQGHNKAGITIENRLPLETNSVDCVLMVHALEFLDFPEESFTDIWRVMKSTGKLIIVVPNRMGLWARSDVSPFGQGQPYSVKQVESFLDETLFIHERTTNALFFPSSDNRLIIRFADILEKFGSVLFPALGGVHIIEASKQLYAGTGRLSSSRTAITEHQAVTIKPVPSARLYNYQRSVLKDHRD